MSDSFSTLGSAALNTPDGKNPAGPVKTTDPTRAHHAATDTANGGNTSASATDVKKVDSDYHHKCRTAHDRLEDRLREEERLARWRRE